MSDVITLTEGRPVALTDFLGEDLTAEQVEAFRAEVATQGRRLRRILGLRRDAVSVADAPDGARLVPDGVAGTLTLGRRIVDIRPKHVVTDDEPWQDGLLAMLDRGSRRRSTYMRVDGLSITHRTFIDQFAMSFAFELERALQHADVRAYRSSRPTCVVGCLSPSS